MIQTIKKVLTMANTFGRNPVFALEMIQTRRCEMSLLMIVVVSQSSIRPGDDSDKE